MRGFIARPEFGCPGHYRRITSNKLRSRNHGWAFIPAPLPPRLPLAFLERELDITRSALSESANGHMSSRRTATEKDKASLQAQLRLSVAARSKAFSPTAIGDYLCDLHQLVAATSKVDAESGQLRSAENVVIFCRAEAFGKFDDLLIASPPAEMIGELLNDMSKFLLANTGLDPIIKAILVNYQIIVTQPFDDGNSRVAALVLERMLFESGHIPVDYLPICLGVLECKTMITDATYRVLRWGIWTDYFLFMFEAIRAACNYRTPFVAMGSMASQEDA